MTPPHRHTWRTALYVAAVLIAALATAVGVNAFTADAGATTTGASLDEALHQRYTEQLELPDGATIVVRNSNGRVSVTGWDGDEVIVSIDKRLERLDEAPRWFKGRAGGSGKATPEQLDFFDAMRLDIRGTQDTLEITGPSYFHSPDANLLFNIDLRVPRGVNIDVRTENGLIAILDVDGDVKAASANGKVSCKDVRGTVDARAGNGGIYCATVRGDLTARAANGSILIDSRELATMRSVVCRTDNGAIKVHVPALSSFEVAAQTANGYIQTDLSVGGRIPSGAVRRLFGEVGDGGAKVVLETVNGSIHVNEF